MSRRLSAAAALLLVASAGLAMVAPASAEDAAAVSESGWWTRDPSASAPSGGFHVSAAPDGDVSVAALRITVGASSLSQAVLVLTESRQVGTADIRVCTTASPWSPAAPGKLAEAPKPSCDGGGIRLTRSTTSTFWSGDVLPLIPEGATEVSVMVVPMPSQPTPAPVQASGFRLELTTAELQADGTFDEADSGGEGGGAGGGDLTFDEGDLGAFDDGGEVFAADGFTAGADLSLPDPVAPEPLAVANESAPTASAQPEGAFPRRSDESHEEPGRPWIRLPLLVLIAAAGGAASAVARRRLVAPPAIT